MQRIASEEPRVEIVNTRGFKRCVAARRDACARIKRFEFFAETSGAKDLVWGRMCDIKIR